MVKAKIVFYCKDNKHYTWLGIQLMIKFSEITTGIKTPVPYEAKRLDRVMMHVKNKIDGVMFKIDKELAVFIKEGRITLETIPYEEKGGEVIMHLEGSQEEIDVWCLFRKRDKVALKLIKHKVEIKVIR